MKPLELLKESLKPTKECQMNFLADALFYLILAPSFMLFSYIINKQADMVDKSLLNEQILYQAPEKINQLNQSLEALLIVLIAAGLLLLLVAVVSWSLSRGLAYTQLTKKKFTKDYFIRFSLMNLLYFILVSLIVVLPFVLFISSIQFMLSQGPVLAYTILIVMILSSLLISYLINLSYAIFTLKNNLILSSIGNSIIKSANIIKEIWPTCLIISIIFILLGIIINIIPIKWISLVIFIGFTAWARRYFVISVKPHI